MTDTTHSCTNPAATKLKGRRANLQKIWSSKEWKEKKAAFLKKNPLCAMHKDVWVSVPAVVPHHPYKESYKGHYSDLELSGCVAYCKACHFAVHKGLKICKVCKERYHRWDAEMCKACFDKTHPDIVEAREKYVKEKKDLQKALRKEQSDKAKAYKKAHPVKKPVKPKKTID